MITADLFWEIYKSLFQTLLYGYSLKVGKKTIKPLLCLYKICILLMFISMSEPMPIFLFNLLHTYATISTQLSYDNKRTRTPRGAEDSPSDYLKQFIW